LPLSKLPVKARLEQVGLDLHVTLHLELPALVCQARCKIMAYNKPELRKRIVASVKAGGKGGKPGQWSARKAQIANQRYEKAGGGYSGPKTESQNNLTKWTGEKWQTKSGKPSTQGKSATGERYLPKKAIEKLTPAQYAATTRAKREGTKRGKQFVPNTPAARKAGAQARRK
jgi:hypothetical protein